MELYEQLHGHAFQFLHCWHELKHRPKWMMSSSKKKSKSGKSASPATSSPCTPDSINIGEDDDASETFTTSERPLGRKASKAQTTKGKENGENTPSALHFKEFIERTEQMDKKKIELFESSVATEKERLLF